MGVVFLGWVHFSDHKVLRTVTKKRMFRNIRVSNGKPEVVQSYLGLLSHGNGKKLEYKVGEKVREYSPQDEVISFDFYTDRGIL